MKIFRTILCIALILFLLFSPSALVSRAQESFVDARFVRQEPDYRGSIVLYHIVRHRPYTGSLTQWLRDRAAAYEKKHRGTFIEIESMDEQHFYERVGGGRLPDAYSFFSGTLYPDRLLNIPETEVPFREGLFQTDRAIPYGYSGYCRLLKTPEASESSIYFANDILAAREAAGKDGATEDKADVLYLDLRRAGDLIRYRNGFSLATITPIDRFTDAVCWLGIDRDAEERKAAAILDFFHYLLEPEQQQSLNALGLMSVRSDVRNAPPDASLKQIFKTYETVVTVDPFLWYAEYDALSEDALKVRQGDSEAMTRFINRLHELCR